MEKIKVAVYLRVNNKDQARELDEQLYQVERYSDLMDWEIVRTYKDLGYSGIDTDRPELKKMIEDVQSGIISNLVVYRLDRLTRSSKDLIDFIDLFSDKGTSLISIKEGLDTSTAFGRFTIETLRVVKEWL